MSAWVGGVKAPVGTGSAKARRTDGAGGFLPLPRPFCEYEPSFVPTQATSMLETMDADGVPIVH